VAHIECAQLRSLAFGDEVAALEFEQLLAAKARVAQGPHDREVAPALQRVVGDLCLGDRHEAPPGDLVERLRAVALARRARWQPPRQDQSGAFWVEVAELGEMAHPPVDRRAVLAHRRLR